MNDLESAKKHLLKNDKTLSKIIKKVGNCNLKPHNDYFISLVDAIVSQQLSVKAAASIFKKFSNHFENEITPNKIIETDHEILRSLGLSNAKAKYVKDLCEKVLDKTVDVENMNHLSDEEITNELVKVKGIGVWTAHMFLIFTLGRLNVLPVGDLGIKKAVMNLYGFETLPSEKDVLEISVKNNWSPYNSVASWYLWRSLENKD